MFAACGLNSRNFGYLSFGATVALAPVVSLRRGSIDLQPVACPNVANDSDVVDAAFGKFSPQSRNA